MAAELHLDSALRSARAARRALVAVGLAFMLPAVLLVGAVTVVPLCQAAFYSFTNWDGDTARLVGLRNYASILTDPELVRSLINSLLIVLFIPLGMILPFVTAYCLNRGVPGQALWRSLIFAPTALSWVVIGVVARHFFAGTGELNTFLRALGLDAVAPNWLASPVGAMAAVLVTFN